MITVLVASYNGSRYIKQQLDSILAQDEKDIHILVSDDCSADGSGELLKEYEERHRDRILVLFRRKPSGGAAAHFLKLLKLMADADHNPDADHSTDADHDTEALPGPLSLLSEYDGKPAGASGASGQGGLFYAERPGRCLAASKGADAVR